MLQRIRAIDRLTSGRMSRREFHKALGLFGLSMVAYPVVTRPARAADNLLVFGWAGFDDPALFPAMRKRTAARITPFSLTSRKVSRNSGAALGRTSFDPASMSCRNG